MLQFRCTQKAITQLRLTARDLDECVPGDTQLGNWYMNLFTLDRRKTFIFMNERTLFSFIVVGIKKIQYRHLSRNILYRSGPDTARRGF